MWEVAKDVAQAFWDFPAIMLVILLVAWVAACWFYYFAVMSRSFLLYEAVLKPFQVPVLAGLKVSDMATTRLEVVNQDTSEYSWKLEEIFLVYWSLRAKRAAVRYITVVVFLSMLFILIMYAAQPRTDVSLQNVMLLLAYASVLGSVALAIFSAGVMLGSAHRIPSEFVQSQKGVWIILLAI